MGRTRVTAILEFAVGEVHCTIFLANFLSSETLIRQTADAMVLRGFRAAGYEYVIIDDCWLDKERGARGELRADPKRFPSGIRALSDYVREIITAKL